MEIENTSNKPSIRRKPNGPIARYDGMTVLEGIDVFRHLPLVDTPKNLTLKNVIKQLSPEIHMRLTEGYSFIQIIEYLQRINIKIQLGTLKSYYYQFLDEKMEKNSEKFNAQLQIMQSLQEDFENNVNSSVRQNGISLRSSMNDKVRDKTKTILASYKANESSSGNKVTADKSAESAKTKQPENPSNSSENKNQAVRKVTNTEGDVSIPTESYPTFGLLDNDASQEKNNSNAAFKTLTSTDDPGIPELNSLSARQPNPSEATHKWTIKKLRPGVPQVARRNGIAEEVYDKELILEHPAIPGLLLNYDQRLYGAQLEIINESGKERLESPRNEQSFRIRWSRPEPATEGRTSKNFIRMNPEILPPT